MVNLEHLPKVTTKSKKRLGRGYGSGKGGHTSSRGTKGQLARSKVSLDFEGGQLAFTRRLPFQRGKLRFQARSKPLIINLKHLNLVPKGSTVTTETLAAANIVNAHDARLYGVKVLGDGKLVHPLTVALPTSKAAAKLIAAAGGRVVTPQEVKKNLKPAAAKAPEKKETAPTQAPLSAAKAKSPKKKTQKRTKKAAKK